MNIIKQKNSFLRHMAPHRIGREISGTPRRKVKYPLTMPKMRIAIKPLLLKCKCMVQEC